VDEGNGANTILKEDEVGNQGNYYKRTQVEHVKDADA
jgi:hypothetical protein